MAQKPPPTRSPAAGSQGTHAEGASGEATAGQIRQLTSRLEDALRGAPDQLAAIRNAHEKSEQLLARMGEQSDTLRRPPRDRISGVEQSYADVDAVRSQFQGFVDRLTELGESSEEKITLLLDGLEAAENARRQLDRTVDETTGLLRRVDATADACEKRLVNSTRQCEQKLQSHTQTQLAVARREINELVAPFRENGEQVKQLAAIARRSADTIQHAVESGAGTLSLEAEKQAERLSTSAGEIARNIEQRLAPFGPDGERTNRIAELTEHSLSRISDATERSSAKIEEDAHQGVSNILTTVSGLRKKLEEQLAPYQPAGEREKELVQLAEGQIERIRKAAEQRTLELEKTVNQHLAQFNESTDTKGRQLASQLQAAGESVRTVSEATRDAHSVLNTLIQNRDATEAQIVTLKSESSKADTKASQVHERLTEAQPAIETLRDALQASTATVEKIESLTHDVWNLTSTTEERARVLGECDAKGGKTVEQLAEAVRAAQECVAGLSAREESVSRGVRTLDDALTRANKGAEALGTKTEDAVRTRASLEKHVASAVSVETRVGEHADAIQRAAEGLSEKTEAAIRLQKQQEDAYRRGEELLRRLEMIDAPASGAADRVTEAVKRVEAMQESLAKNVERAEEIGEHVETAADHARTAGDRIVSQTLAAEQMMSKQRSLHAEQGTLAQELCKIVESGAQVSQEIDAATSTATKAKDELMTSVEYAETSNTEVAQLLAAVVERRESLEAADEILNDYVDRAEALRIKLQQLQTRSDSFAHQINGMLTEPRKIVEDAKLQAGRLDGVCRSVRKVFGGLSQTSLQANRDISRFNEISREANDKLAELTNETNRAARTLHEWIDEAVHAHSRLSKTLTQVPSVAQTHPTDSLSSLAKTSTRLLSDVLRPISTVEQSGDRRGMGTRTGTEDTRSGKGKRDELTSLIREAEGVAEANV